MSRIKMRILFTCGREPAYTRNSTLLKAFQRNGEVTEATSSHKSYTVRHFKIAVKLLSARTKQYDVIFVGFYGQLLLPFVKLLYPRTPIVFDAYISTYQTLCFDRKKFKPQSVVGKTAFMLDTLDCKLATKVILDTNAHIDYFTKTFKVPKNKFERVFVGADESIFYPRESAHNPIPTVFTYSAYQPLHGTEVILKAAKQLEHDARFVIVGKGQERAHVDKLAGKLELKNTEFIDWLDYKKLPGFISRADICLGGHFGDTDKARMVIAGKTFQFLAMDKLTIVSDNPANKELLSKGAYFVQHGSSDSLASGIKKLIDTKDKTKLRRSQHSAYKQLASFESICEEITEICTGLKLGKRKTKAA